MNVIKSAAAMDVDCPVVTLKRSSSAPMINEISATMSVTSTSTSAPRDAVSPFNLYSSSPRTRRFSTSSQDPKGCCLDRTASVHVGSQDIGVRRKNTTLDDPRREIGRLIPIPPRIGPAALKSVPKSNISRLRDQNLEPSDDPESPGGGSVPRLTPRVSQLRQEECVDVAGREAAHEKEIHSAMQMSQSYEDLTLDAEGLSFKDTESPSSHQSNKTNDKSATKRPFDPLSLNLTSSGPPLCSSPSPTRPGLGRQCYSPGLQFNWKNNLSPSPTRKAFATRRSLSPIAIRASCLGPVKRKFELDDNNGDQHLQPPAKRTSSLVISHSSRLEGISSPLPGSLSSVGTPESLSSADSPSFSFRPVDSPSPGRILSSGDEPMSDSSGEQTKGSDEVSRSSNNNLQHNNQR